LGSEEQLKPRRTSLLIVSSGVFASAALNALLWYGLFHAAPWWFVVADLIATTMLALCVAIAVLRRGVTTGGAIATSIGLLFFGAMLQVGLLLVLLAFALHNLD